MTGTLLFLGLGMQEILFIALIVLLFFDGEYIKKMSIIFDIKIILMTVVSVFTSKGVREGRNESSNNR